MTILINDKIINYKRMDYMGLKVSSIAKGEYEVTIKMDSGEVFKETYITGLKDITDLDSFRKYFLILMQIAMKENSTIHLEQKAINDSVRNFEKDKEKIKESLNKGKEDKNEKK